MKVRSFAFLMIIGFLEGNSFAQSSFFKKAVLLKTDSIQLNGYVERVSERAISQNLVFKNSFDQITPTKIPTSQIERLIFQDDSTVFEKVPYALPQKSDSDKVVEYRLAKKMLEGYANLYKMQLPKDELKIIHKTKNTFVYFLKIDTTYYMLDQQEKRIETEDKPFFDRNMRGYNYVVLNNYKQPLLFLFQNAPKFASRVKHLKLEDRDIVPLIIDFNNAHPDIPRKILIKKDRDLISHGPFLGLTRFPVDDGRVGHLELGYLMQVVSPQIHQKLSHQLGFSGIRMFGFDHGKYEGAIQGFKLFVSSRYMFLKGKTSPFLGIGLSQNFSEEMRYYGLFNVFTGATLFKRCDITVKMESLMPINSWRPSAPAEKILTLNLGYRFGNVN